MSTGSVKEEEFTVEFKPLGEAKSIILTPSIVDQYLMVKTSKGVAATKADVRRFLETCAAQCLNPWLGDAFLIGYDLEGGGAKFSLVTSHQAILKRAEASSFYDGMKSGVITLPKAVAKQIGETGIPPENVEDLIKRREGDLLYPWECVIGGWADVKRKDHAFLSSDALEFEVYTTGKSRWAKDPAGMIVKCAEASAQRKAFPTTLGTLYIQEEMESVQEGRRAMPVGLEDQRQEQQQDKIVIPSTKTAEPEKEKVPVPAKEERERSEVNRAEMRQEPSFPEPVQKIMDSARRAKSALALVSIKQGWLAMKGNYPAEMVETVDKYLERRGQEVTPEGERPKS